MLKIRSPTCQILSRHRSLDHRLHHLSRLAVFYFSVVYLCPWIAPVWLLVWLIPRRLSIIISQGLFWFVDNDRTWGSSRYSVLCSYKNTHYQSSLLTFLTICVSKWEGLKLTISCPEHLAQKCHRSNVQVIFPGCGRYLTPYRLVLPKSVVPGWFSAVGLGGWQDMSFNTSSAILKLLKLTQRRSSLFDKVVASDQTKLQIPTWHCILAH